MPNGYGDNPLSGPHPADIPTRPMPYTRVDMNYGPHSTIGDDTAARGMEAQSMVESMYPDRYDSGSSSGYDSPQSPDEKVDMVERDGKSYHVYKRSDGSYYGACLDEYGNKTEMQEGTVGTMADAYSWIDDSAQERVAETDPAGSPPDTSFDNQLEEVFEDASDMTESSSNGGMDMDMDTPMDGGMDMDTPMDGGMDMDDDRNQGIADAMSDYRDDMNREKMNCQDYSMDKSMEYRGMPKEPTYRSRGGRGGRMRY